MRLTVQRRLAADVMGCGPKRVWFDQTKLEQIKESITKADIRSLVNNGVIQEKPKVGNSKGRTRDAHTQKKKGRQKGQGSRKGKKTARTPKKITWMNKIRLQREYIRMLRTSGHITPKDFRQLYAKCKGGYFRSKRHVKLFLDENNLLQNSIKSKK